MGTALGGLGRLVGMVTDVCQGATPMDSFVDPLATNRFIVVSIATGLDSMAGGGVIFKV